MRNRKGGENKERYLRRRQCGKEREEEQEREGTRSYKITHLCSSGSSIMGIIYV